MKYGRATGTAVTFLLLIGLGFYAIAVPLLAKHDAKPIVIETAPAAG